MLNCSRDFIIIFFFQFPQTTPNTSAIFAQGFPHIPFTTLPQHHSSKLSQPPPQKAAHPQPNHYTKHLQNVRKFHEDLHSRLKVQQQDLTTVEKGVDSGEKGTRGIPAGGLEDRGQLPSAVSSSFLMTNLRCEAFTFLDEILIHFSHFHKRKQIT